MQNNPSEDTSAYWRKLLRLDGNSSPAAFSDSPLRLVRAPFHSLINLYIRLIARLSCSGVESLPQKGPFIIASNHVSSLDFPCVFYCLPTNLRPLVCAMYKKYFDRIPPLKWVIKAFIPSFSVDMERKPWEALALAAGHLKSGRIIYIAPEGTRSKTGEMLPFKVGIGTLAVETGVPTVPIYIKGTDKVLPSGKIIARKGHIHVAFGKPICADEYIEKKKSMPAYDVYKEMAERLRHEILLLAKD